MSLISKKSFLDKYYISDYQFNTTGYDWEDLNKIYIEHEKNTAKLEEFTKYLVWGFIGKEFVHSVRFRVKDPEHLIEKIIRQKAEKPEKIITSKNYFSEIKDLIGIRIIHLYKEDWLNIHNYIKEDYEEYFLKTPIAYHRNGDSEEIIRQYQENGCEPIIHIAGYRSIHYNVKRQFKGNIDVVVEIQVRTLFEEGWSEIDHQIRYPYNIYNKIYNEYLLILNRLSGSADEMGSFIKKLDYNLTNEKKHDLEITIEKLLKENKELKEKVYINKYNNIPNNLTNQEIINNIKILIEQNKFDVLYEYFKENNIINIINKKIDEDKNFRDDELIEYTINIFSDYKNILIPLKRIYFLLATTLNDQNRVNKYIRASKSNIYYNYCRIIFDTEDRITTIKCFLNLVNEFIEDKILTIDANNARANYAIGLIYDKIKEYHNANQIGYLPIKERYLSKRFAIKALKMNTANAVYQLAYNYYRMYKNTSVIKSYNSCKNEIKTFESYFKDTDIDLNKLYKKIQKLKLDLEYQKIIFDRF